MSAPDPDERLNLTKANVLAVDGSAHSLDVIGQILRGFGVSTLSRCSNIEEAEKLTRVKTFDLIIIDPSLERGEGYAFVNRLRHSMMKNANVPVVLTTGHVRGRDVARGRDTGANYMVAKPVSPKILLQRIEWVARDPRPFVDIGDYIGPDRRFKFAGPPDGSDGRRTSDLKSPLGDASEPNLSQDEVNAMIKPQRVTL